VSRLNDFDRTQRASNHDATRRPSLAVLTNLIAIVVIFAMFDIASTPFEAVVVSGLTLVYVGVNTSAAMRAPGQLEIALATAASSSRSADCSTPPGLRTAKKASRALARGSLTATHASTSTCASPQ
jgi:hypothetical protein